MAKMHIGKLKFSAFTAFGINLIFAGIYFALVFVLTIFFSAAALFDPLNQMDKAESMWTSFPQAVIFHALVLVLSSVCLGFFSILLIEKTNVKLIYLTAAAAGLLIQWILSAFVGALIFLIYGNAFFVSYVFFYVIFMAVIAPLQGIASLAVVKPRSEIKI